MGGDIRSAMGWTLLVTAAGFLGAAWDEVDHLGARNLFSLCAAGTIPPVAAVWLELQLMPGMFLGMTAAAVLLTVLPRGTPGGAPHEGVPMAAAHLGCLMTLLMSLTICTSLVRVPGGFLRSTLLMLGIHFAVMLLTAVGAACLLRSLLTLLSFWTRPAAGCPPMPAAGVKAGRS